ncbi:hypothetical protein MD484_g2958, partial [Candolleomyces efflorescens]
MINHLTFKLFFLLGLVFVQGQLGDDVEGDALVSATSPNNSPILPFLKSESGRDAVLRDMGLALAPVLVALLVVIAAQMAIVAEPVLGATTASAALVAIGVVHKEVAALKDRPVAPMAAAAVAINIASLGDAAPEERSAVALVDGAVDQAIHPAGQTITVAVEYFLLRSHFASPDTPVLLTSHWLYLLSKQSERT